MNVMAIARSIGLVTGDRSAVSGTIDEEAVLIQGDEQRRAAPEKPLVLLLL